MVSQIAGRKANSYGNSVCTLNVKCPMRITTGGVYFIFINVPYFSLKHHFLLLFPGNLFLQLDIIGPIIFFPPTDPFLRPINP